MKKAYFPLICLLALLSILIMQYPAECAFEQNDKEVITISGNILFDEWEQGMIRIAVYDVPHPRDADELTYVDVPGPGKYSIKVEALMGQSLYIHAYNDFDNDGPPIEDHDPRLYFDGVADNPLPIIVDAEKIFDINLTPEGADDIL
jgi:hypothetical protein